MTFSLFSINSLIFSLSLGVILLTFGLYSLFLILYSKKKPKTPKTKKTNRTLPRVSVVLPTFNEGGFIKKKIKNLLDTDYDIEKLEIIIVDDSTDEKGGQDVIKLARKHSNVRFLKSEERRGYSQALLDGFKEAEGEIVIITDCGSLYDTQTIPQLVKAYSDPLIGGVTGSATIINKDESTGKSESFYRKIYDFMRKSESNADSTFHFHGEVSSVRKELLDNIPYYPTNLDIEIAFHIRRQGYKVVYDSEAKFYEFAPKGYDERHRQKSTRATGLIKVILGNKRMFSPKYGIFGIIIYPAHFLMMIICPLFIASGGLSYLLMIIETLPQNGFFSFVPILIPIVFFVLFKRELLINFLQIELVLLFAIFKALTVRSKVIFIDKIESTRREVY